MSASGTAVAPAAYYAYRQPMRGGDQGVVVGAFSEAHAARLTGVSVHQLRRWDQLGFFAPSFADDDRRKPYSRVYSFRDLVGLRVLNELRNVHRVPLAHLREVARELEGRNDDVWGATRLSVLNKRVVFDEPETGKPREVVGGQYVAAIPLAPVVASTRQRIADMNRRGNDEVGRITRARFVLGNAAVLAGTRIPVRALRRFAEAGLSPVEITHEFPDLTVKDVEAALAYKGADAAA